MVTCCTALCWGLGLSSLSSSSLGAGMMLDSQVEAVITFSLLPALAWACAARAGAEFSLSLESSPLVTWRAGGWGSREQRSHWSGGMERVTCWGKWTEWGRGLELLLRPSAPPCCWRALAWGQG